MSIKDYLSIALKVLSSWQVIVTVVLMIMVMYFANMIINYRKKPKVPKRKKGKEEKTAEPAPAAEEKEEEK